MNDLDEENRDDVNAEESDDLDDEDGELDDESETIDLEDAEDLDAIDDETEGELRAVEEELSPREQNARSLAIRRAIEHRMEQKRLDEDLDYFDLDMED
jgi:hypothetical protein